MSLYRPNLHCKLAAFCSTYALLAATSIQADACDGRESKTIYYATHAFEQPFFPVLEAGAAQGASDACLDFVWTQDKGYSIPSTVARMKEAVAAKPDMLVFAAADPRAMMPVIDEARDQDIPVIAINVPLAGPVLEAEHILTYIGPDEYLGGVTAAERVLEERTPNRSVCLNSIPGHAGTEARCRGWEATMAREAVASDEIDVSGGAEAAKAALQDYLEKHPETDAFVTTTGDPKNFGAVAEILFEGAIEDPIVVTFDLTPGGIDSIAAGDALAAIDQQPYLQGYLASVLARQYLDAGLMPASQILTGPSVVDASNVDQIAAATKAGRR